MTGQDSQIAGNRGDAAARQPGRRAVTGPVCHQQPDSQLIDGHQPVRGKEHRAGRPVEEHDRDPISRPVQAIAQIPPAGHADGLRLVSAQQRLSHFRSLSVRHPDVQQQSTATHPHNC
jgi:hypothetical protein